MIIAVGDYPPPLLKQRKAADCANLLFHLSSSIRFFYHFLKFISFSFFLPQSCSVFHKDPAD